MVLDQDRGRFNSAPVKVFVVGVLIGVLFLFSKRLGKNSGNNGIVISSNTFSKVQNVLRKYLTDPQFKSLVDRYSSKYAMPNASDFLLAQIAQENTPVDPTRKGDSGKSYGLMQIQKAVAEMFGYKHEEMFDIANNLDAGTSYMVKHYKKYGNWHTALRKYNGSLDNPKTKDYADSILANFEAIKALKP